MSDAGEKSVLVAKVVDVIFSEMLSKPLKVRDDWPEHVKEHMLNSHAAFRKNHRRFALELYEEHMTVEQLQELLNFHTSEIGKSIDEAQATISSKLNGKYRELEAQTNKTQASVTAFIHMQASGPEDEGRS